MYIYVYGFSPQMDGEMLDWEREQVFSQRTMKLLNVTAASKLKLILRHFELFNWVLKQKQMTGYNEDDVELLLNKKY